MTSSLNTSEATTPVSEKKLGKLKDLLTPILRRHLKTEHQAQKLIEAPSLVQNFDRLVSELVGKLTNTFTVKIDYTKTLSDLIDSGNYAYVNSNINAQNFPLERSGCSDIEISLVHFGHKISSGDVIGELQQLGLRPAILQELLALGAMLRTMKKEFAIVALGSLWLGCDGYKGVPYLGGWTARYELRLDDLDAIWPSDCRFAAIRKSH